MNNLISLSEYICVPVLSFLKLELFYSSILFFVILILTIIPGKKSPHLQMGLWSLLLIRLVLPTGLSSHLSLGVMIKYIMDLLPFGSNGPGSHPDLFHSNVFFETGPLLISNQAALSLTHLLPLIVLGIWLTGTLIFLGIFYYHVRQYHHVISVSTCISDPFYTVLMYKWKRIFKIKRNVRLITSQHNISPFTTGLIRPVIYLPAGLLTIRNTDVVEPVIAHEMAHIHRYDALWIRLQNIIQSFYFFHPAAWVANIKINHTREFICDGRVLMTGMIARDVYGKGLLSILKMNLPGVDCPAFIPGFKSPKQNMKERIHKIKGEQLMKKSHIHLSFVVILLAGLFLLPMAGMSAKSKSVQNNLNREVNVLLADNTPKTKNPTVQVKFQNPLNQYVVTAAYGAEIPFNGKVIKHKGIDLKATRGTDVYAAADGVITEAVETFTAGKGYGKYIVIQHADGMKTVYAHLDQIVVKQGQVNAGDLIGQVGDTGQGTGPHLHFELLYQGENVDPADYINF